MADLTTLPTVTDAHGVKCTAFARVYNAAFVLAVSVPPNGKTLFYCEVCHGTFLPRELTRDSRCPFCARGAQAPAVLVAAHA